MGTYRDNRDNRLRRRLCGPAVGAVGFAERQAVSHDVSGGCVWPIWIAVAVVLGLAVGFGGWPLALLVIAALALARVA